MEDGGKKEGWKTEGSEMSGRRREERRIEDKGKREGWNTD